MRLHLSAFILCLSASGIVAQAAPNYSSVVNASGPVGYWRLSDNSPDFALNEGSKGAALDAPYVGFPPGGRNAPGLINGDPDTSADFAGSAGASYISGTGMNTGGNPFSGDWTIEAWFQRDSKQQWSAIFSNNNGTTLAPLMTFRDTTNEIGFNGAGVTADGTFLNLGTDAEVNGKTVYAVITKTGTNAANGWNATVYAWVDGVAKTPISGSANFAINTSGDAFYIGRHWAADTQILDGRIDEVAIYNRALSAAEVTAHFNAGASVPEPAACATFIGTALTLLVRRRNQRG